MTTQRLGHLLNLVSGVALLGVGIYFIFLRPAFLPEDIAYIGIPQRVDELLPRLADWLHRVFLVLGGFIASTGLFVIQYSLQYRSEGVARNAKWFLFCAWFASIGLMSAVNFSINSDFKWPLFALAVFWFIGIVFSTLPRRV